MLFTALHLFICRTETASENKKAKQTLVAYSSRFTGSVLKLIQGIQIRWHPPTHPMLLQISAKEWQILYCNHRMICSHLSISMIDR